MNTQLKFILAVITGLSFWLYSNQNSRKEVPSRSPASEDFELRERYDEETDYYDSYQFQRDPSQPKKADARPDDPNQKSKKMKRKKSKDPIGDDVEWSKLDPTSLIKLQIQNCKLGNAKECYHAGISQIGSDRKLGIWYISKSCNLKNYTACLEAAKLLNATDARISFPYYKSACENMNHPEACFAAAEFLNSQQKVDYEATEKYYKVSCLEGNDIACQRLGFETSENFLAAN
ncbi:MAG: hypothetical protein A4S09_15315 [Proteobacteria bacterium SG_bin7]|nr:MAG: hypothetical protein A4S09_15315 [Proteobacteria bacterium SG_bin7]